MLPPAVAAHDGKHLSAHNTSLLRACWSASLYSLSLGYQLQSSALGACWLAPLLWQALLKSVGRELYQRQQMLCCSAVRSVSMLLKRCSSLCHRLGQACTSGVRLILQSCISAFETRPPAEDSCRDTKLRQVRQWLRLAASVERPCMAPVQRHPCRRLGQRPCFASAQRHRCRRCNTLCSFLHPLYRVVLLPCQMSSSMSLPLRILLLTLPLQYTGMGGESRMLSA